MYKEFIKIPSGIGSKCEIWYNNIKRDCIIQNLYRNSASAEGGGSSAGAAEIHMKILVVEDDKKVNSFISKLLENKGYTALQAYNGHSAVSIAASHSPGLVLLNMDLPDMEGLDVLRHIREWSEIPVIVVSSRESEQDKVSALDSGANDYVTKPFGNEELMARVRSAVRMYSRIKSPSTEVVYKNGDLTIDYERRTVAVGGQNIHLTPIEYKIVLILSKSAGKVLTHDQIIEQLWGPFLSDSQILRVNVANIRRKIETDSSKPRYIITEIGVGYRMSDGDQ